MRNKLAKVQNVNKAMMAFEALANRDLGIPGMGLFYGFTGAGKSTTVAWLINRCNGIFVRANAVWTPSTMLGTICQELGALPQNKSAAMLSHIIERMALDNRPLFVDEADYLLSNLKMLETLRDIHDSTGVPVVLIGMDTLDRKLVSRKQLCRRISQWVEFQRCSPTDAKLLAETVCEVSIGDGLIDRIFSAADGSIGLMTVALARVESFAKAQGWRSIDADQWGDRQFFLGKGGRR